MYYKIIKKGYREPISLYDTDKYEIRFINPVDSEDIEKAIKILRDFEVEFLVDPDGKV